MPPAVFTVRPTQGISLGVSLIPMVEITTVIERDRGTTAVPSPRHDFQKGSVNPNDAAHRGGSDVALSFLQLAPTRGSLTF